MSTIKHRVALNPDDSELTELTAMVGTHDSSLARLGHRTLLELLTRYRYEWLNLPLRLEDCNAQDFGGEEYAAQ